MFGLLRFMAKPLNPVKLFNTLTIYFTTKTINLLPIVQVVFLQ